MIGAMPAVAVRHERRRAEKRIVVAGPGRRPSQLPLQLGRPQDVEPTPSPDHNLGSELYICGKVAVLHAIVGSLLLGIVVLVVGLVQLSPGAEAAQHRYYLIYSGAGLVTAGILCAVMRCVCLHYYNRKFREEVEEEVHEHTHHKNGVNVVESGHGHGHDGHKGHDKGHHVKSSSHDKIDKKAHDKSAHDKTAHDKTAPDKTPHHDSHDKVHHEKESHEKGHENEKGDKHKDDKQKDDNDDKQKDDKKLKTQASVVRDSSLTKQQSGTSDT